MQLLYISTFLFHTDKDGIWALPSCSDSFFAKYLDVYDSVRVLGEEIKTYLDKTALVRMINNKISVSLIPANTRPIDFRNDALVNELLKKEISKADAILIKPASRRGMMAIKIAEKLHKPYMIEMTGDIHNALMQSPSKIKRMYAPILYRQIKHTIRNCKYGLYVSKDYLQGEYPIKGKMCGCSDVVLDKSDVSVLERRLEKIDRMQPDDTVQLALIGFYQGNGKGVDTAIRALGRLPENFHLSVLGNGTEESRKKWYEYAREYNVNNSRLHFPEPLPSAHDVLLWLDDYDFFVFPTRSEGLPRVLVEAISRGCPCFATNICTMPELLPSECLFQLDDDKKLADLLRLHVADKEWMKQAARINFEHAKDYDVDILKTRRNKFLTEFKEYCIKVNEQDEI